MRTDATASATLIEQELNTTIAAGVEQRQKSPLTTSANSAAAGSPASNITAKTAKPKLGFLGVGWIGLNRMEAIHNAGSAEIRYIADAAKQNRDTAIEKAPAASPALTLDEMLTAELDGVVIATPSALHAEQSLNALSQNVAVFCQKPLARTKAETLLVVEAARSANKLLGVDLSYRYTKAMKAVKAVIDSGELGNIYAIELTFHNAYGPDKPWFYIPELSGGGCVIDLGVHMVDLALWATGFPAVENIRSSLFTHGQRLSARPAAVEDYAHASFDLSTGAHVQLTCSWNLPAGQEVVIAATFYGTNGAASFHNVEGSFYNFVAERYRGTSREVLFSGDDDWSGRAAVEWTRKLAEDDRFQEDAEEFVQVAEVLDRIYGR